MNKVQKAYNSAMTFVIGVTLFLAPLWLILGIIALFSVIIWTIFGGLVAGIVLVAGVGMLAYFLRR